MSETIDKRNQPFHAAGRLWTVPRMTLSVLPDGTLALSQAEIDRIHRAVANAVCGNARSLSTAELEFLCDVTGTCLAPAEAGAPARHSVAQISGRNRCSGGPSHTRGWGCRRQH